MTVQSAASARQHGCRSRSLDGGYQWAIAALIAAAVASPALADDWLNPAGGDWTGGANWSKGAPPTNQVAIDIASFSLGSQSGYTVTNCARMYGTVSVVNDNVTLIGPVVFCNSVSPLNVGGSAGASSSLTVQSGSFTNVNGGMYVGGSGTTTLTVVNTAIKLDSSAGVKAAMRVGGPAGSVTSFNQVAGTILTDDFFSAGTTFGSQGVVKVNLTGATIATDSGAITFGGAGGVTATLNSTVIDTTYNNAFRGGVNFGTDAGKLLATDTSGTIKTYGDIDIGTLSVYGVLAATNGSSTDEGPGVAILTGGGTAGVALGGCTVTGQALYIGASGGTGTLVAGSGSNLSSTFIGIGYANGTGSLSLSGGSRLNQPGSDLMGSNTYIGGGGGHGTVSLSGIGTAWNCSQTTIFIGYDRTANGVGVVTLDHGATLTDVSAGGSGVYPIGLNLSAGGTLSVLSGARVNVPTLTEVPGSTLVIGLDSPSVADNGQINLTGAAAFAGTLEVVFKNGNRPIVGQQFQLFTFASESGQFSAVHFPPGYAVDTAQLYSTGNVTITAVPEPIATFGAAGLVLSGLGRRRTR